MQPSRPQVAAPPPAQQRAGMTLIELLVVMALVGILSAIALPRMAGARDRAVENATLAELRMLDTEVRAHEVRNGSLPADLAAIDRADFVDAWGNAWTYTPGGGRSAGGGVLNTDYDLYSHGPDGALSDDDIARADDGAWFGVLGER